MYVIVLSLIHALQTRCNHILAMAHSGLPSNTCQWVSWSCLVCIHACLQSQTNMVTLVDAKSFVRTHLLCCYASKKLSSGPMTMQSLGSNEKRHVESHVITCWHAFAVNASAIALLR